MAGEVAAFGQGRGREVEGLELRPDQAEEGLELLGLAAVRGGGEEDEVLAGFGGDLADEVVALLLGGGGTRRAGAGVGLVDDHQLGALLDEHVVAGVGLDVVDADDLVGIVVEDAGVALDLAVEAGLGVGADDDGLDVELGADLLLPLFAEVGQTDHGETLDGAAFEHFADDEQGLDGFADADIVRDEESHGVLAERHDERHDLVGAGAEGEFGEGAEGAGAVAEGEAGRVVDEAGGADVAEVGGRGGGEAGVGGAVGGDVEREVDAGDFVIRAAEGLDDQQIFGVVGGQDHPLAAAKGDELAGLEQGFHRTFRKMSGRRAILDARSSR